MPVLLVVSCPQLPVRVEAPALDHVVAENSACVTEPCRDLLGSHASSQVYGGKPIPQLSDRVAPPVSRVLETQLPVVVLAPALDRTTHLEHSTYEAISH
jgi:hypothetical protein